MNFKNVNQNQIKTRDSISFERSDKNRRKYNSLQYKNNYFDSFENSKKSKQGPKKTKRFKLPKRIALILGAVIMSARIADTALNQNDTSGEVSKTQIQAEDVTDDNAEDNTIDEYSFELSEDFSPEYIDEYNTSKDISDELSEAVEKDLSKGNNILSKSSIYSGKQVSDEIKSLIAEEGSEVNGYIDSAVAQGITGDCWLIGGIENLSYTESGAKALYDSLSVNDNGDIEVYFKGPDLTYTVTPEELEEANKSYTLLSLGDDDMLVFEIAVNKFRQDLADNKIEIDENLPDYLYYTYEDDYNALTRGEIRQAYWLFTGITDSKTAHTDKDDIDELLNDFRNNPNNSLLSVDLSDSIKVCDIEGNEFNLISSHTYGIKDVDDTTITLINPYQNISEIVLPIETLYELPIGDLIYCSLE